MTIHLSRVTNLMAIARAIVTSELFYFAIGDWIRVDITSSL